MDDGLKQRLIGAVVLVAAAVIFIPVLFDEDRAQPRDVLVNIPARPEVPKLRFSKPAEPSKVEKKSSAFTGPEENSAELTDAQKQQPQFDRNKLPVSWTLQLASFQTKENAQVLRDKLRKDGFKAYIRNRPDQNPAMVRVFVGPELKRADIEALQSTLDKKFKLKGIITRFYPE